MDKLERIKKLYLRGIYTAKEVINEYMNVNFYNSDDSFNSVLFNAWSNFIGSYSALSELLE